MKNLKSYSTCIKLLIGVLICSFSLSNITWAGELNKPATSYLSPSIHIGVSSFTQLIQKAYSELSLATMAASSRPESDMGEDGFVFGNWLEKPIELAQGKYAKVEALDQKTAESIFEGSLDEKIVEINEKLEAIKRRLLAEGFFSEEDFKAVEVIIQSGAWKSAFFKSLRQDQNSIYINLLSFKNLDFLYIVIKHELTDLKLKRLFPDIDPALREAFTLINVNIAGFMNLRNQHPIRARRLLDDYRDVAHSNIGLFIRYQRILNNKSLNDPFALFEDICRMVAEEKVYFPNMRQRMQALVYKDGKVNPIALSITRLRVRDYLKALLESKYLIGDEELEELSDYQGQKIPAALTYFKPYAKNVRFRIDQTTNTVFIKVRFVDKDGKTKYAHFYFGLKDKVDATLGKGGHLFGLTFEQWKSGNPHIFDYQHTGVRKMRGQQWTNLIRLPLTKMIKKITPDAARQQTLKTLMLQLLEALNIDKSQLSRKTWLHLQNMVGRGQGPRLYYVVRNKYINYYLDSIFPQMFLGLVNVRNVAIQDLQIWPATENPDLKSALITWMLQSKSDVPPRFYIDAGKVSLTEVLSLLSLESQLDKIPPEQTESSPESLTDKSSRPEKQPLVQMTLFDLDARPDTAELVEQAI